MLYLLNSSAICHYWFTDMQTVLGPVVVCGPQGLDLLKPMILSFQHCASIKHGRWNLMIYNSESPYDEPPQWQVGDGTEPCKNRKIYITINAKVAVQ